MLDHPHPKDESGLLKWRDLSIAGADVIRNAIEAHAGDYIVVMDTDGDRRFSPFSKVWRSRGEAQPCNVVALSPLPSHPLPSPSRWRLGLRTMS
jgi:hypothetical protein